MLSRLSQLFLLVSLMLAMNACQQQPSLNEQSIISYFDKTGNNTSHAVTDGSYRKLLKIQHKGFLVQNFFVDTHNKQTDPFIIEAEQDLKAIDPISINGAFRQWYNNGQLAGIGYFEHGKRQGQFIEWTEQGNKLMVMNFVNDQPEGKTTLWYQDGHKYLEGQFNQGKETGIWTVWQEDGQLKFTVLFFEGNILSGRDNKGNPLLIKQQDLLNISR